MIHNNTIFCDKCDRNLSNLSSEMRAVALIINPFEKGIIALWDLCPSCAKKLEDYVSEEASHLSFIGKEDSMRIFALVHPPASPGRYGRTAYYKQNEKDVAYTVEYINSYLQIPDIISGDFMED